MKNKIDNILENMIAMKASDLHLSADRKPKIRLDGEIIDIPKVGNSLSGDEIEDLIYPIMGEDRKLEFLKKNDIDFAYEAEGLARFRVNCFKQKRGIGVTMRIIPTTIPQLGKLGLSTQLQNTFKKICKIPRGLVLVTGATGSGKTTTLAAMVDYINEEEKAHILTIEDPIEFVHKDKLCLINQREVHEHTDTFNSALRAALREDPDIILVGEMRDLETIRLALSAAETGHLVFATLHTTSAPKTIDRIVDAFPAEEKEMIRIMLSESLEAVISQVLIKKIGGGRVAAHEIMICNSAIRNLIRENKTSQMASSIQVGSTEGMISMENSINDLIKKKIVTVQDAQKVTKKEIKKA